MTHAFAVPSSFASVFLASKLLFACPPSEDRLGPAVPDFVELRSGGYSGLVAAGLGYSVAGKALDVFGLYGFVPARIGGKDIHSVLVGMNVRVPGWCPWGPVRWVPFYLGFGGLFTAGEGFFLKAPARYSSDYYLTPTGMRGLFFAGTELDFEHGPHAISHGPFWEAVVVDHYFLTWLQNQNTVSFWDVVSSAVGYRIRF